MVVTYELELELATQNKVSLRKIFIEIVSEYSFGLSLFLIPACALVYSYIISDRTISQGYNESLYEAVAYPETINYLSEIRYIYKDVDTHTLNKYKEKYGFVSEFKENKQDRWKILCIESLVEFRSQSGEIIHTTVSYTQAQDDEIRLFTNSGYVRGEISASSCEKRFNVAKDVIWLRLGDSHLLFGAEGFLNVLFEFSPVWINQTPNDMFN